MTILELLKFILSTLEELNIPHMVVGAFASGAYGDPRFTRDIDIVIAVAPADIDRLIAELPEDEFYVSREAALEAVRLCGQFNVIHPTSGIKIDLMIARDDAWGREQMSRRHRVELMSGLQGFVARPEDVVLAKLIYYQEGGSDKHLRDIASMFRVSGAEIDRGYIERWVAELGLNDEWNAVRRQF